MEVQVYGAGRPWAFETRAIDKNDFNIVRTDYIRVHLSSSTPQNTTCAQRDTPGITIFLIVSLQDDADLIVNMCVGAKLESRVQCHGRNC